MTERTRREQMLTFLLTPAVVLAVVVLAVITYRTTFQIEKLRERSVMEATLSVANEKADRVDKRIVEEDNVVVAVADPAFIGKLAHRWLPTAARETPTVRAVLVLNATGDHEVLDFASRKPGPDDDEFRRLLVYRLLPHLELSRPPIDELRHLHRSIDEQSYLISYWQRQVGDKRYLIVAWHDVPQIVHYLFPRLLEDATGHANMYVADEEGRTVFGEPVRGSQLTVGRPFQTTLYGWRLHATLTTAAEYGANVERRRELEMITVGVSFLVVVSGVVIVVVAAERERRLAALKSEFVANVSHELKTPLALVRMFSELLATDRVRDDAKRKQYLSIIVRESDRLSALIENVLDFARVERGKAAYDFEQGDLGETVKRAVEACRYRAEGEGLEVTLQVAPQLPATLHDARAIELALLNLIDNAVKYAKDGKRLEVVVSPRGARTLELRVVDHGPGIAPEERRLVFERFVRGHGARERQIRGSGIGLALVQHIARSHGGQAWVESTEGGGSTFILTIPVRAGDAGQPRTQQTGESATAGGSEGDGTRPSGQVGVDPNPAS